jgi:hypothetical protein
VNCTTIREVLLTPTHLGLVLELEAGGTLAEEVARRVPTVGPLDLVVPEEEARFLFKVSKRREDRRWRVHACALLASSSSERRI